MEQDNLQNVTLPSDEELSTLISTLLAENREALLELGV